MKKRWNSGYIGLDEQLVSVLENLKTTDRVRITSKQGESYVGYLFNPDLLSVKYRARLDRVTQVYIVYYDQIRSIEKIDKTF